MNTPITTQSSLPGRSRKAVWLGSIATLGILCLTVIPPVLSGEPTVGIGGAGPEGSWLVSIATPDGKTWEMPTSYCAGGAMVGSDSSLIGMATASHGTWMQTGRREFTFTMVKFINNTTLDVLPKGMLKVVIKETDTIEPDGDTYNGSGSLEMYGPDGTRVVYRPVVPSHAVRIKAE
ncbi:MAG: hypothetical protein M1376_20355 [Planctomycetes bacterium]|nr:hypothetical protein [Planctomycetota bacterium]